jgi:hypothetical protein
LEGLSPPVISSVISLVSVFLLEGLSLPVLPLKRLKQQQIMMVKLKVISTP